MIEIDQGMEIQAKTVLAQQESSIRSLGQLHETSQEAQMLEKDDDKVKTYMKKRLRKANMDLTLQRHKTRNYYVKNMIAKIKIRSLRGKLKEALRMRKRKDKLELLNDSSIFS